jgi:hypothetical protein
LIIGFYWHLGSFLGVQFEFFDGEANIFRNGLYDKLNEEVRGYNGLIRLMHNTFGDAIRYNRPRMDSGTKEFDQQHMLGLEYLSCSETEEEKSEPKNS